MNKDTINTLQQKDIIRNKHPYWIWESIMQIPDLLSKCMADEVIDQIEKVANACVEKKIDKIILIGRGSSFFATLAEQYLFRALTDIPTYCYVTNVFESYPMRTIDTRTAFFFHSTSGRSEGDTRVVELVKRSGSYTVGVTDIIGSDLAKCVDDVIIGPGGAKVELPATRTYTTAMFRMFQFAINLAKKIGDKDLSRAYDKQLTCLPEYLGDFIPRFEQEAPKIVDKVKECSSFVVLGYGPNVATADEGAMALSQSAGVPAASFELENFIHGPIQALTKNMGVFAIAPAGPLQDRMLRTARAAGIIGAKTIILAPENQAVLQKSEAIIPLPSGYSDLLSPILYMVPIWQLAYHLGLLGRGGHPDRLSMDKQEFKDAIDSLMKTDKWVS
jgi:glucosamine 6-phosphate synthetase-like amidotransferase/phosphosugar isomerase protein